MTTTPSTTTTTTTTTTPFSGELVLPVLFGLYWLKLRFHLDMSRFENANASFTTRKQKPTMIRDVSAAWLQSSQQLGWNVYVDISGQISIVPKPELRGFGGDSLTKPPFKVTSAEVVIICPDICCIHLPKPGFQTSLGLWKICRAPGSNPNLHLSTVTGWG